MRYGILRHHCATLRLRPDAPFPSQLKGRARPEAPEPRTSRVTQDEIDRILLACGDDPATMQGRHARRGNLCANVG